LRDFDEATFDRAAIRAHAEQFAPVCFRERFEGAVTDILAGAMPPPYPRTESPV
jgi:hypothetical protein